MENPHMDQILGIGNDSCFKAKKAFYSSKLESDENDHKEFFKLTNTLLHKKKDLALPSHGSSLEMANKFVDFFTSKVEKIYSEFTHKPLDTSTSLQRSLDEQLCSLTETNTDELCKIITSDC